MESTLPPIPAKRYFTIGEVGDLCGVKPHVLRYWEQEFTQLRPMKRRGNRRYYQHHEVLLIRRIRDLLYDQGFTISGARNQLGDLVVGARPALQDEAIDLIGDDDVAHPVADDLTSPPVDQMPSLLPVPEVRELAPSQLRAELLSIRDLLLAQ